MREIHKNNHHIGERSSQGTAFRPALLLIRSHVTTGERSSPHSSLFGHMSQPGNVVPRTPPSRVTCHTTLQSHVTTGERSSPNPSFTGHNPSGHMSQPGNVVPRTPPSRVTTHPVTCHKPFGHMSQTIRSHVTNHRIPSHPTGERSSPNPSFTGHMSQPGNYIPRTPPSRVTCHTTLRSVTRHCSQSHDTAVSHTTMQSVTRHCSQSHDNAVSHTTM
jgi:hypothetical protein